MGQVVELRRRVKSKSASHADDLSFMQRLASGVDYWTPKPTGNSDLDWSNGRALGAEYLAYIGENPTIGNTMLLGWIVREMVEIRGDKLTGLELGFLEAVNKYAMSTAYGFEQGYLRR